MRLAGGDVLQLCRNAVVFAKPTVQGSVFFGTLRGARLVVKLYFRDPAVEGDVQAELAAAARLTNLPFVTSFLGTLEISDFDKLRTVG